MNDALAAAALAGLAGTVVTLLGTTWASRRFGLPGLAREVDQQREDLLAALRENNERLRAANERLALANARLENENRDLRAKLATAYDDIAELYRALHRDVPAHVARNREELRPAEGDA